MGMPQDNIKRAIQRGTGEIEAAALEEIAYEGYGPGGVALLIHAMTENRNRTVGEVRSTLSRHGGNLGATGCVSYLFENKGVIVVDKKQADEDTLMELALESKTPLRESSASNVLSVKISLTPFCVSSKLPFTASTLTLSPFWVAI
jgi:transcriptional/translational regulatory protein YebC/TACO1